MEERTPEPTWMYRSGGASKLFEHPDDVPEGEGWEDSPAKCRESKTAVKTFDAPEGTAPLETPPMPDAPVARPKRKYTRRKPV